MGRSGREKVTDTEDKQVARSAPRARAQEGTGSDPNSTLTSWPGGLRASALLLNLAMSIGIMAPSH